MSLLGPLLERGQYVCVRIHLQIAKMRSYFAPIALLVCQDSRSDPGLAQLALVTSPLAMACVSQASDKGSGLLYVGSRGSDSTAAPYSIVACNAIAPSGRDIQPAAGLCTGIQAGQAGFM